MNQIKLRRQNTMDIKKVNILVKMPGFCAVKGQTEKNDFCFQLK